MKQVVLPDIRITLRMMESLADYNDFYATVHINDIPIFEVFLKGFNHTDTYFEVEKMGSNKRTVEINGRDAYGYEVDIALKDLKKLLHTLADYVKETK